MTACPVIGGATNSGQENAPTDLPTDQSDRSNFSVEVSSSNHTTLCQADKTIHHTSVPYLPLSLAEELILSKRRRL